MSDQKKIFPTGISQNPYPNIEKGQAYLTAVRNQVENILEDFKKILPSNYVSEVTGPFYSIQFQAIAEQLAKLQITAQEVFNDTGYEFTRSEFLWQLVTSVVYPTGSNTGIPSIDGDISFRDFLNNLIPLFLKGATKLSVEEGLALLTGVDIEIIEKFLALNVKDSLWGYPEQFEIEINISKNNGTAFPFDPFLLQDNLKLVLQALKPAHIIYDYRHVFREIFSDIITDSATTENTNYYYEDFRHNCQGLKEISGFQGETLKSRFYFRDVTRDFSRISKDAILNIVDGENVGLYRVLQILHVFLPNDPIPRKYQTVPTGLSGKAICIDSHFRDENQNWSSVEEGEILTILEGPNAGSYRIKALLGLNGGYLGYQNVGASIEVSVSPSILRIDTLMPREASNQTYSVSLDRLGVKTPITYTETVSSQFFV